MPTDEDDNILSFRLEKADAETGETYGTLDNKAGPDGLFWDCIWKSTGQDLSAYFSPLPKGESAFQANLATGEIVIGDNLKPSFLLPGSHAFTLGKRIEIPSDCFGLGFHIMDPVPENTSALWTDVDRFVNAPLDYVIIFEKKLKTFYRINSSGPVVYRLPKLEGFTIMQKPISAS